MPGYSYKSRKLLYGKTLLIATVATIVITLVLVFLTGLESHRSFIDNALISLSMLAGAFFLFISFGLYYGVNVKDDLSGKLKFTWSRTSTNLMPESIPNIDLPDFSDSDGCGGILVGILAWIGATIAFIALIFLLEYFILTGFLFIFAIIYWVLIRALKLIFAKSAECEKKPLKSLGYGLGYTLLYIGWVYGVIFIASVIQAASTIV